MQKSFLTDLLATVGSAYTKWFHTRNIIVVSEHKVKHIPINGSLQFAVVLALVSGMGWGTYSTGSYFATRATLKTQGQALRAVANTRVNYSFGGVFQPSVTGYNTRAQGKYTLSEPMLSFASPDPKMFYAHIARLEQQVSELKTNNETIIARVKEKTGEEMAQIETVIRNTGLNADDLKRQVANKMSKEKKAADKADAAEGGPYLPDDLSGLTVSDETTEMYADLDKLAMMKKVLGGLPLARPITGGEEQSTFGRRVDPFTKRLAFHSGLDIAGPAGSSVKSTGVGKVIAAGRDGAYGNAVDIDHGFGIVTRYGHMSSISVKVGQQVSRGDVIGIQGSTGRSTGAHVHYEVRYHDKPMDPKNFLNAQRYAD